MSNRVTFLITIALVCISVLGTVILVSRFTREEYQPTTVLPPLPEIPKEEVKEVAFQYAPEVYRDPFKAPTTVRVAMEKPKEETVSVKPVQPTPVATLKPEPVKVSPIKETKVIEAKKPEGEVKVNEKVTSELKPVEPKREVLPSVKLTGIIYDDNPLAIIEFEGKSGIFKEGERLNQDLIVKKIYLDSLDLKWKDKVYNIKLGG